MYSGIGEHPLSLNDDELLVEIQVPVPEPSTGAAFEKLAYRSAIDYAVVSAGAFVKLADKKFVDARLVIGAVSRGPLLISTIEEILKNKEVNDIEALEKAGESAMNTAGAFIANNVSQPAAYRIQMVAVLAKRAIRKAAQRALSGAEGEGK
jgi:CO/xanthine dehydrogenase FAD-binding subunit